MRLLSWPKSGSSDRLLSLMQRMPRSSESCLSCINIAEGMAVDKDARAMAMSVEPNIIVVEGFELIYAVPRLGVFCWR